MGNGSTSRPVEALVDQPSLPRTAWGVARCFANWPRIFAQRGLGRLSQRQPGLILRARCGITFETVPGDAAWSTVLDTFVFDCYRLSDLPGGIEVVVDIGANIGAFALAVAARFPHARVYCYEPGARAFDQLVRNVTNNGLAGRVQTHKCAVVGSSREPVVDLWEPALSSSLSSIVPGLAGEGVAPGRWEHVPAVELGSVLGTVGGPVDVLKLDVEGAEYEIFGSTAAKCLSLVSNIVVEYHAVPGVGPTDIARGLEEAGFAWLRHEHNNALPGCGYLWFRRR